MPRKKKEGSLALPESASTLAIPQSTNITAEITQPPQSTVEYACPCKRSTFPSKTQFLKAIKEQDLDYQGRCSFCNSLVVACPTTTTASSSKADSKQPQYQSSIDYAMKSIPQSHLVNSSGPISIQSPKTWADLAEEQDAQDPNDSWSVEEFNTWCKLMHLPIETDRRRIREQQLLFAKNVVASRSPSTSPSVAAPSTTSSTVVAHNPTSRAKARLNTPQHSMVHSAPTTAFSSPMPQPIRSKGPSSEDPTYIKNDSVYPLLQIEPEFWSQNPLEVANHMLSPSTNFIPKQPTATQRFYEFILVDTQSCLFKPHADKQDTKRITHTTAWLKKVLSPKDWGIHPLKYKRLSQPFEPQFYNYYDYQAAWMNAFTYQNDVRKHSWFLLWDKKIIPDFPQWFIHQWWPVYGLHQQILPPPVQEGYKYFCEKFHNIHQQRIPSLLQFSCRFHIPWIFSQKFAFQKTAELGIPWLCLQGHTKWYKQWNAEEAQIPSITKWFQQNPKFLPPTDTAHLTFLQQKSIAAAQLASSSNKDEFVRQMEQLLHQLKEGTSTDQSKVSSSTGSSTHDEEGDYVDDPDYTPE